MIYFCFTKGKDETLNMLVEASGLNDLFWKLDEFEDPYMFYFQKIKHLPTICFKSKSKTHEDEWLGRYNEHEITETDMSESLWYVMEKEGDIFTFDGRQCKGTLKLKKVTGDEYEQLKAIEIATSH